MENYIKITKNPCSKCLPIYEFLFMTEADAAMFKLPAGHKGYYLVNGVQQKFNRTDGYNYYRIAQPKIK